MGFSCSLLSQHLWHRETTESFIHLWNVINTTHSIKAKLPIKLVLCSYVQIYLLQQSVLHFRLRQAAANANGLGLRNLLKL